MTTAPYVMAVGADQPDRSVKEFVARGKTMTLSNASGGTATPQHVAALMFFQMAGLKDVTMVQYKGAGAALPDVVAGRVSVIFDGYISSKSFISTGKLIPWRSRPPPGLRHCQTFRHSWSRGTTLRFRFWLGLLVRTGTPKDAVQRLSEASAIRSFEQGTRRAVSGRRGLIIRTFPPRTSTHCFGRNTRTWGSSQRI